MKAIVNNRVTAASSVAALDSVGADALKAGFDTASLTSLRKADGIVFGTPANDDEIRVRFAAGIVLKGVAIHGHNFETDVDLILEQSADNFAADIAAFGSVTIQKEAGRLIDIFEDASENALSKTDFRLRFNDKGSQVNPWEVGELVFAIAADQIILSNGFLWGYVTGRRMNNRSDVTPGGSVWSYHLSQLGKTFALSWRGLTLSSIRELETIFDLTKGSHLPFTVIPFDQAELAETTKCFYVRFASDVFEYTTRHTNDRLSSILLAEDADLFDGTAA